MKKCDFKPRQWVLARDLDNEWILCQFSHFSEVKSIYPYVMCGGTEYNCCIPYKGNEHLRGTTAPYVETKSESGYVPKDGDFVTFVAYVSGIKFTAICDRYMNFVMYYHAGTVGRERIEIHLHNAYSLDSRDTLRPATSEEKNLLLSKLREIGKDWDEEKKQIVDYNPPYEPKDGDFVYVENSSYKYIFIKKEGAAKTEKYISLNIGYGDLSDECHKCCDDECIVSIRPATEEEKNQLLSKLHEIGKDWNAEKKEVVKWKWEPNLGEGYYFPSWDTVNLRFETFESTWTGCKIDSRRKERNFVIRTKEECQTMCDKLNESIK